MEYTGRLEDGSIFDTTDEGRAKEAGVHFPERKYGPMEFKVGEGKLIRGFEKAILGMKAGEEKTVKLAPEAAFQYRRDDLVLKVPIDAFRKKGIEPKVGVPLSTPRGLAVITTVSEAQDKVEVDYNHPLAGKAVIFEIKVVEIKQGDTES